MLKLGITGGIGSGKSLVSKLFGWLGIPVFDSDKVARVLIDTDPVIREALMSAFGKDIYLPEGKGLDRRKVGAIVFSDKRALATLNTVTHPPVIRAAQTWMKQQQESYETRRLKWLADRQAGKDTTLPPLYVIKEAALLFESGTDKPLDGVLGVYADRETRIRRVMERDHISPEAIEKRMHQQLNEQEKMDLCDWIILNNGQQLIWPQVLGWHRYFQTKAASQEGWLPTEIAGKV